MKKFLIVNKSDSTGGAAVVSRRLMEALRESGAEARMLVAEKLTDSPYVRLIAPKWRIRTAFLLDRVRIAFANGFDRKTLFKLDAAAAGIDISGDPWVEEADVILINWINQGVLSLRGIEKLLGRGKRVVWTMHDMWNFTGLCHHAGECRHYMKDSKQKGECGDCPLLGKRASANDFSKKINEKKARLYRSGKIQFVAVSNWLADRARESHLLSGQSVSVIPNPIKISNFTLPNDPNYPNYPKDLKFVFGAARLDDPIKDFPMLIASLRELKRIAPEIAERVTLHLFGGIKDSELLNELPVAYEYHGVIRDPEKIAQLYLQSDIVISTSRRETLPGTLIEGQAYGSWPIAFRAGGQPDIITHGETGWLVDAEPEDAKAAAMAEGIAASVAILESGRRDEIRRRMRASVIEKFSPEAVANRYMNL